MKYLMLVCTDPSLEATAQGEDEGDGEQPQSWVDEMDARGTRVIGDVTAAGDATTVRVRGGEVLLTDGPYVESNELIAGFDVLECADLDEALEVVAKHPMARFGVIELRPFLGG